MQQERQICKDSFYGYKFYLHLESLHIARLVRLAKALTVKDTS